VGRLTPVTMNATRIRANRPSTTHDERIRRKKVIID
jgi:hypothetical protein